MAAPLKLVIPDRVLNLMGIALGLFSIAMSYFLYVQSTRPPILMFYADPLRATIVDAAPIAGSPDFQFLYKNQPIRSKTVASVFCYFWNSGPKPIRWNDMLKPPAIVFLEATEILAVREASVRRSESKIKFGPTSALKQNRLPIFFEVLEESDGAALQIVFAGDLNTPISFEGTFVGVPKTEDVAQKFRSSRSVGSFSLGAGCLMFVLYIVARFRKKRSTALTLLCGATVAEVAALAFMHYGDAIRSIPLPLLR
jgi:hypothetical protein